MGIAGGKAGAVRTDLIKMGFDRDAGLIERGQDRRLDGEVTRILDGVEEKRRRGLGRMLERTSAVDQGADIGSRGKAFERIGGRELPKRVTLATSLRWRGSTRGLPPVQPN